MKKYLIILLILIAVLILVGFTWYFNSNTPQSSQDFAQKESTPQSVSNRMVIKDSVKIGGNTSVSIEENSQKYQEYSAANLENAKDKKRILFFYANWCPTCRPVDSDIKANLSKIPDDVSIIRVNYNDDQTDSAEKELAKTYGITYQHTFVRIDSVGNEIDQWNGGDFEKLLNYTKALSPKNNQIQEPF